MDFEGVLLAGLAPDGGLYMPEQWPPLTADTLRSLRGLPYAETATRTMFPFVKGCVAEDDFAALVADAYAGFDHGAICPLKQLGSNIWLMELFHGPTLAFKDMALQLLGRLFDHVLHRRGQHITIVGATSGDTGSAAIEACRDREAVDIFILHPKGRTSEVQRRQMTTVTSDNVHNIALEGSFDDCQDIVKALFNDVEFRTKMSLSAVNSINWARIMAQIVYYIHAGVALGAPDRAMRFAVPTGNFGNVFAAYAARRMGLPVEQLIIGSNSNDILTRFFENNDMSIRAVTPTLSPSMDIQISSNFERFLFEILDRDGAAVEQMMRQFRDSGVLPLDGEHWEKAKNLFAGARFDDVKVIKAIRAVYQSTGEILDPHTAVGVMAGQAHANNSAASLVCMATAHPAKFSDAVEKATGIRPTLPSHMADLYERDEKYTVLPNATGAVRDYIRARGKS